MPSDVRLPPAGTMTEAVIVRWHVTPGQRVRVGEPLCEVETKKAVADLFVPADGTIAALLTTDGERVTVDQMIAVIAAPDEDVAAVRASAIARASRPKSADPATKPSPRSNILTRLLRLRS